MKNKIHDHLNDIQDFRTDSAEKIEAFRIKYLGSKGLLKQLFSEFKDVEPTLKKEIGQSLNQLRNAATEKINELKNSLDNSGAEKNTYGDLTRPGEPVELGARHPISIVKNQIIDVFSRIGFNVSEGPEIEDDWHNFTALTFRNIIRPEICRILSSLNKILTSF